MTYGGLGLCKKGVQGEDHAAIFTGDKPYFAKNEVAGFKSVKMNPISPNHNLDRMSRLNYAKLYTVEHNVKVFFVGKVHEKYHPRLRTSYDEIHKPLSSAHDANSPIDEETANADGSYGQGEPYDNTFDPDLPPSGGQGYSMSSASHGQSAGAAPRYWEPATNTGVITSTPSAWPATVIQAPRYTLEHAQHADPGPTYYPDEDEEGC